MKRFFAFLLALCFLPALLAGCWVQDPLKGSAEENGGTSQMGDYGPNPILGGSRARSLPAFLSGTEVFSEAFQLGDYLIYISERG